MKVNIIKNYFSKNDVEYLEALLYAFCYSNDIQLQGITIDLRKTVNNYTTEGLFGGFGDMYSRRTNIMYFNPHNFIEYKKYDIENIAHLAMHELIHVKQIKSGEMYIYGGCNKLQFKGISYRRAPFNTDLFSEIRMLDGALAERYHMTALPWEKDAYEIPEDFMGKALWENY